MKNLLLILFLLFLNRKAFSLVDYTDDDQRSFKPRKARAAAPARKSVKSVAAPQARSKGSSSSVLSMMDFSTEYKSTGLDLNTGRATVSTLAFNGHIKTPYNLFIDFSYGMHSSDNDYLAHTGQYQSGNPEISIGLNWLTFGSRADLTTIDFIAGYRFAEEDSSFATSRDDKIIALETTKRFHSFVLGLGYKVDLTGAPSIESEQDIGNISRVYAKLGLEVSADIKFLVEAQKVTISENSISTHSLALQEDKSFGIISPSLILGLTPMINMRLGGVFRTKRLENIDALTSARLYTVDGIYGNSLVAGLNINL